MGHQAHAQPHTDHAHVDHGHAHEQVTEKSENGCADAWASVAIITVVIATALFWLAGHAS